MHYFFLDVCTRMYALFFPDTGIQSCEDQNLPKFFDVQISNLVQAKCDHTFYNLIFYLELLN